MDNRKLIHSIGSKGETISFNPDNILAAQPNGNVINETQIIMVGCVSVVREPHSAFVRKWEAALNGKEAAQVSN